MRLITVTFLSVFLLSAANAQESTLRSDAQPQEVRIHATPSVRDAHHDERIHIDRNLLQARRASSVKGVSDPVQLDLPIRPGFLNTSPGFFGISNYVDLDDRHPDLLLDWNCGMRTYDTESFDHNGIDYQSAAFSWLTMQNDGLIVVAAADGEIIDRHDGEPDKQCSFDPSSDANRVIIEHDDGSVAVYAHMKTGTVTPRKVGDRVEAGDYLGVVGSSGLSTGPHLHLGLEDAGGNLVDPYAGECNNLNSESWWRDQEDYYVSQLNDLRTNSDFPVTPPCPQVETPNFSDMFAPTDTIFWTVFIRDALDGDMIDFQLRDPNGSMIYQTTSTVDGVGHSPSAWLGTGVGFGQPLAAGAYTLAAIYKGKTMRHTFYVDDAPDPPPQAVNANNAYAALYFDPALDGEGYNFVTTPNGTIVYFYGSDKKGNRLWLISDLLPGPISDGVPIEFPMYESTGGVFTTPVPSVRGLSYWGTVIFEFDTCEGGKATLSGIDGVKVSNIIKLAGAAGAACVSGDVPADNGLNGLFFTVSLDGEGYNLLVAPPGRILYFYGFKANGLRLWLISDLITDELPVGQNVEVDMFEATQGTFDNPVPSDQALVKWGTGIIRVNACGDVVITLNGVDGSKTSNNARLAEIIGIGCTL